MAKDIRIVASAADVRLTPARRIRIVPVFLLAILWTSGTNELRLQADDWPQWRGPRRNAVSAETGLLRSWPEAGPKVAWNASGLGTGYASVVVRRGRVFTMGKQGDEVVVTALDAMTGKPAWVKKIGTTSRTPCSTPTVDEDRLYALGPDGDLVCLKSSTGELLWQKSFLKDFGGRMMSGRGYGESPLVDEDRLICTPGGKETALVALDKRTGSVLWKATTPDLGSAGKDGAGFSSVVATKAAGVRQYVQLMGRGVMGVDASDGRFLWGYNAIANNTANIPTPVVREDLVFAANGYNAGSVLLQLLPASNPGEDAPRVKAQLVYSLSGGKYQNHHGGTVLVGDYLYGGHGSNNGLPTCVELKTGRIVWKVRGPGEGSAAVVYADGHLYYRYQNGVVALIEANPNGYYLKGTLQIPGAGGDSWAHPVVANGKLYLREKDNLWVYDVKGKPHGRGPIDPVGPLPVLDASTDALRKLNVAVLPPLSAGTERERLFAFAGAIEVKDKAATSPPIVILTEMHLTSEGLVSPAVLSGLTKVRVPFILDLAGTPVRDTGLKQLRDLNQIKGLNLELCGHITDAGLEHLQLAKDLRVLILAGTNVTHTGLQHLASNKSLKALDLEVCDGVTDVTCKTLGEMRQLKALVLKKTGFEPKPITATGLRYLENLESIELLNLHGNQVTDAGLVHLKKLSRLRELNLNLVGITDAGLAHLQTLSNLQRLDLLYSEGFAGPTITNAGLASLKSLTNLKALNLTGARVTDAGLENLRVLNKLTQLRLVNSGVTLEGIRTFKAALPGCEIVK